VIQKPVKVSIQIHQTVNHVVLNWTDSRSRPHSKNVL